MGEHRRRLIQDYEDAKLALLLDEYAEAYGKVSTEQFEKELAAGKIRELSGQEQDATLNAIIRRAEEDEAKESRIGTRFKGVPQKISTVVASVAIFFALMVTVQAAGIDVFGAVGRWTDGLFHFEAESGANSSNNSNIKDLVPSTSQEIRKVVSMNGFPLELAPSWLPDGFSISKTSFPENGNANGILLFLEDSTGNWILYQIDRISNTGSFGSDWVEKDDGNPESFISNDMLFYIFQNNSIWTGTSLLDEFRLTIADSNGKEDLLQIILSIGVDNHD